LSSKLNRIVRAKQLESGGWKVYKTILTILDLGLNKGRSHKPLTNRKSKIGNPKLEQEVCL
jgi:hypothetical protein